MRARLDILNVPYVYGAILAYRNNEYTPPIIFMVQDEKQAYLWCGFKQVVFFFWVNFRKLANLVIADNRGYLNGSFN